MLDIRLFLVLAAALSAFFFRRKHDPREPPVVGSFPLIGHLIGMLWYGVSYFNLLAHKHANLPIFSLNILGTKFHLIASPSILQAVQRNNKTVTFDPFLQSTAERMAGISNPQTLQLLREKSSGGGGLNQTVVHALLPTLTGRPLDRMNEKMASLLSPLVDELVEQDNQVIDLYGWCRHAITVASTEASYGPLNPYKDAEIEDAFWNFESNMSPLLANFLPSLIARKSWTGREKAVKAFIAYYAANGHEQGSELTMARWETQHSAGLSGEEIARNEVTMGIGLLSNTVPACFWVLYNLYARPELLSEIRQELATNAMIVSHENHRIIDISAIRDACPLLLSTYQEILRYESASAPTRFVTEDTLLQDRYLLKRGSLVNIPGERMGWNEQVWGSSAGEFNPRRFIKSDTNNSNTRRIGAFVTFGVSPVICPGRHFATSEILGLVAMMVLRFDMFPINGWKTPKINSMAIASSMRPVQGLFNVKIVHRKEYHGSWSCRVSEGTGMFNLTVG
ncbi:hypothetical protein ASPZODRAFT_72081 [Penicilliopsis zonata CBS 506.65]|uniref:Cytochrome P450 n=1 Tax=Penicilliopsis zonata CBS 506.65 TaxID=1073090 RepID=A0A1L9SBB3_9EURO|nr:hypothetical protein ASPZODRAFT_72081 [Penicilliopsis zonata CBS 506.65]OJJ44465.1 hypothetical protein ASPZODRAFT_72081 [Penicilliopsis zonata CBS 506.65]